MPGIRLRTQNAKGAVRLDNGSKSQTVVKRGYRRFDAANYIGVSPSKFDQLVQDGRMPKPVHIDGCIVWDVRELDAAFEAIRENDTSWDDFR